MILRVVFAGFFLTAAACAAVTPAAAPEPVSINRVVVVDHLKSPWSIAFLSETEALVTEKEGGLLRVDLTTGEVFPIGGLPSDLVDDIRSVVPFDNGGLFEVLLDPVFEKEPWVYLSYAAKSPAGRTTKVIRAKLLQDTLSSHQTLLVAEPYTQDEFFHYGGGMVFGSDGKLYVTIGERIYDETSNPDLPIAQDPSDRRGKIYRLNRDGTAPDDNPDFGPKAPPGLYALGIRAAQGLTLHPDTGEIWFSEHGSRQGDEINRLEPAANYGWPIMTTGKYRNDKYKPPELSGRIFAAPAWVWLQTVAPTGLTFYHGSEFPPWRGDLFVSGLSRGSLWRFKVEEGTIKSVEELFVDQRVRSRKVAVSPGGVLYMLTDTLLRPKAGGGLSYTATPNGQLLRIVPGR